MPYIPHSAADLESMLSAVGAGSVDELFADIAPELRAKSFLDRRPASEDEVLRLFDGYCSRNADLVSFLGAGYYDHCVPSAVDALAGQSAFVTAYTPYQAECSQGTLQAIFEFQTAVARLMDLDCANASLYDGGTALFEAAAMAARATRRKKVVVDECVNPLWRAMLATYSRNLELRFELVPHKGGRSDSEALKAALDKDTACVIVQNPSFFGCVEDHTALFEAARAAKALSVMSVNPVMLAVLKTPGAMGADIAVAEGQSLGLPLCFGGPYLGLMACRKALVRQMPGRLVGRAGDHEGRVGYVLTLQAREQHIRRSKATSNICSNQSLCALRCLVHLSLLGPQGLADVAEASMAAARSAAKAVLEAVPGASLLNDAPYANEFALRLPVPAARAADLCHQRGCAPGYTQRGVCEGMDDVLLVACTEKSGPERIASLADALAGAVRALRGQGGAQ